MTEFKECVQTNSRQAEIKSGLYHNFIEKTAYSVSKVI